MSRKSLTPENDRCGEHPIFGETSPAADAFAMSILTPTLTAFVTLLVFSLFLMAYDLAYGKNGYLEELDLIIPAVAAFATSTVVFVRIRHVAFIPAYATVAVVAAVLLWTHPMNPYSTREDNCSFYGVCEGWGPKP
jgi:hypothetical protein